MTIAITPRLVVALIATTALLTFSFAFVVYDSIEGPEVRQHYRVSGLRG